MAFDSIWKPLTGANAFNAAANWDGGVPETAEEALISAGSANISSGLEQAALDLMALVIGQGFEGSIGTPTSPLELGDTGLISIRATKSKELHFRIADSHTCDKLIVRGTDQRPYACAISSGNAGVPGVWDEVHCECGMLRVTSSAKINNLYVSPRGVVIIEGGATVANIHNFDGRIHNSAAIGTKLYQRGGLFVHEGTSAGNVNIALAEIHGGNFKLNSKGAVIGFLDARGGVVDGTEVDYENTITAMSLWYDARATMNESTIHTANPVTYGNAKYSGPGTPSQAVPSSFAPA